jgi:hypothetical protein
LAVHPEQEVVASGAESATEAQPGEATASWLASRMLYWVSIASILVVLSLSANT